MYTRPTSALRFSLVLWLLAAPVAGATPIQNLTFEYSGMVSRLYEAELLGDDADSRYEFTDVEVSDFLPYAIFSLGDSFSGSFTYELTSTSPSISDDGAQATYLGALVAGTLTIGDFELPSPELPLAHPGYVALVDDRNGTHDIFQIGQSFSQSSWFMHYYMSLHDRNMTAINGFDLPTVLSLDMFSSGGMIQIGVVERETGNQLQMSGSLQSFRFVEADSVSVSEPAVMPVLAIGLLGLVMFRRKFAA